MTKSINLVKPYFAENRNVILLGLFSLIIVDVLQLVIPIIIKWCVDDLTSFSIDATGLLIHALQIAGLAVAIGTFRYIWRQCLIGTSRRLEEGLRNTLFAHIQTLPLSYFAKTKTGDLMAHATNDIHHIRMATGMGLVALNDAVVLGIAAIGFMIHINLRLTLLVLIPMPLIALGTRIMTRKLHSRYQDVQAAFSDMTEIVRERFTGIRIIKAYNREEESTAVFAKASESYVGKNMRLVKVVGAFFPLMVFLSNLCLVIVLYFGGRQTIVATISPGDFVAFISYLGILTWPMMALGWVTNLIQRGKASLDRVHKILETESDIVEAPDAKPVDRFHRDLRLDDVSFAHDQKSEFPALSDIRLKIEKGKMLGIVGPPGSGKSTLLHLIPRLYDVSKGRILVDGTDIRDIGLADLRSLFAFVPQEPFLFDGTILKNIAFSNTGMNGENLEKAVHNACLSETIKSFPNGLDTIVGEKGIVLSGGQKQRIALARALMTDAPILILDDPVSQVDTETGNHIINRIRSLTGEKTILIASHRLSALRFADEIITLENGRIVESGTHDDLLKSGGYYARTFDMQEIGEVPGE